MIIKCPECGHQVSDRAKTCPSCGIEIEGRVTACPECGEAVFKYIAECPYCHHIRRVDGETAGTQPAETAPTSTVAAPAHAPEPAAPQPPVKKRRSLVGWLVSLVIALIAVFLGIYFYQQKTEEQELHAYRTALVSDEPAVLQGFLDKYADAPQAHRDSIEAHLALLRKVDTDWAAALLVGTKAELEKYMQQHPQSIHNVEAKIKLDSIDWVDADREGTVEAYRAYLKAHEDGAYYDEALARAEQLEAQRVNADDQQVVKDLFAAYFQSLSALDEESLTQTLAPVLTSFLHRVNATKSDVIQYMHKLHQPEDINNIKFALNNDWKIDKQRQGDAGYQLTVEFSVDEHIDRSDADKERFCTYKVQARVNEEQKISELNMRKIVQ